MVGEIYSLVAFGFVPDDVCKSYTLEGTQMSYVFHRHCHATLPIIDKGEGVYLFDKHGKQYPMLVVVLRYQTLATAIKPLKSHVGTARASAVCSYWIFY